MNLETVKTTTCEWTQLHSWMRQASAESAESGLPRAMSWSRATCQSLTHQSQLSRKSTLKTRSWEFLIPLILQLEERTFPLLMRNICSTDLHGTAIPRPLYSLVFHKQMLVLQPCFPWTHSVLFCLWVPWNSPKEVGQFCSFLEFLVSVIEFFIILCFIKFSWHVFDHVSNLHDGNFVVKKINNSIKEQELNTSKWK